MKVNVTIKDNNQINILFDGEIEDEKHIIFNNGFFNQIDVYDNGIVVTCINEDHKTKMELVDDPHLSVETSEGILNLPINLLDFYKSSDKLIIRYQISEEIKEISINYTRR